jgi:hypothetical protein
VLWPSANVVEKQQWVVNGACKHNGEVVYIHVTSISVKMISISQYENMALISPKFTPCNKLMLSYTDQTIGKNTT